METCQLVEPLIKERDSGRIIPVVRYLMKVLLELKSHLKKKISNI